ncbi:MAG: hypothetical protein QXD62_00565 [Candidatus Woesearchaeota archaeon]
MIETVKQDIISVLQESIKCLRDDKIALLKEISDHTIHNCTVHQDQDSINTAVLLYSLYKIFKTQLNTIEKERLKEKVLNNLEIALISLQRDDFAKFNRAYRNIFHLIEVNKEIKESIQHVIVESKIKKGARIIYHGLTLSRTSDLLGISMWELMNYLGNANVYDSFRSKEKIEKRMKFVREFFEKVRK